MRVSPVLPSSTRSGRKITATFPSLSPPVSPPLAAPTSPGARRRHRTSGERGGTRIHIHSISFKEKRNASSIATRLSTPSIDPNLSQKGNLTSSRLDAAEQRSCAQTAGGLLYFLGMCFLNRKLLYPDMFLLFLRLLTANT